MNVADLPASCPDCNKPLNPMQRRKRTLQKKTYGLLFAGVVASAAWSVVVLWAFEKSGLEARRIEGLAIVLFVIALPALGIGAWALSLPKLVRLSCPGCRWRQTYRVRRNGEVVGNSDPRELS
jgi:hypothetical protein